MAGGRTKVFFDGGCRPNPGRMEAAVVVRGIVRVFDDTGIGTNTDAEWQALILALEVSQAMGLADFDLIGDSVEVIRQANAALAHNALPLRGPAKDHAARFLSLAIKARPARIRWIKREQNLAGIALSARHSR